MCSGNTIDAPSADDIAFDLLVLRYLDGLTTEEEDASLHAQLLGSAELRKAFVRLAARHGMMMEVNGWRVGKPVAAQDVAAANQDRRGPVSHPLRRFWISLAAAASLVSVAGLWWFNRSDELGLCVVQASGECHVVRGNGSRTGAAVGLELHQGERIVVNEGSRVALKYAGEETTITLYSAVAAFSRDNGAKHVTLDSGLLLCTAAQQVKPLRIDTPHGMVTVVGTRFALDAARGNTALAVRDGTVALSKGAYRLEVKAGKTAVIDEQAPRIASDEDAWLRELAIRAETGPWDAVDFGKGVFTQGNWSMDARSNAAECLLWNGEADPRRAIGVAFDTARWKRGVLRGRIMVLGDQAPAPALPVEAKETNSQMSVFGMDVSGETADKPVSVMLYLDRRDRPNGCSVRILEGKGVLPDVWYEVVLYFDLDAEGGPAFVSASWPEDGGSLPVASDWKSGRMDGVLRGKSVGFGLVVTPNHRIVVKGLKFVPQGADMPPPPAGLLGR